MNIDRNVILKLEALAQLELSEEERGQIKHDLENILTMVDKLKQINTDHLEPLVYLAVDEDLSLRKDEISGQLSKNDALKNASKKDENFFLVPKVIEK